MRTSILLFLTVLLSGCGAQPYSDQPACCTAPPPGTVSIHMNGNVTTSIGVSGH